ncbi:TonB-dependent receptor [soil metagenome]
MSRIRMSKICTTIFMATTALSAAHAQPAAETPAEAGNDIIVTGTRATGTMAAESATPIQLLSEDALSHVGQPNLNQALTQLVPSFQAQTQGTDMASFSLSARLRGLSPNHTLVMVNGKRRHGNSILQVINGAFGGSAAPSIDLIAPDIVKRIEILQDGAAAQYGTDAIAGAINIILKNDTSGGAVRGSVGQYYDGEGITYSASSNFGLPVGDNGFIDIALFERRNDYTMVGDGQFTAVNLNGSTNSTVSAAFKPIYDALNARNGTANINGGQPKSRLDLINYNAGYDFGNGLEVYSFGDLSYRHGDALQGYRPPNRICASSTNPATCFAPTVANGMVPHIEVEQEEFSITGGIKGSFGGWDIDAASTYAEDVARVLTTGSANASLFTATGFTPRDFYDGKFTFTQYTGTIDVRKSLDIGFADPLNLAFGGEYRKETYAIGAGDVGSLYIEGGQSFPGYSQTDALRLKRNTKAVYADVIIKPVPDWSIDIAGRYEHYSDFGNTTIGKINTRYDFSPAFALRGTVSTGFRAPSLQESGYSSTNVGPTSATLQLAPSSAAAASAGFGALKPEKSTNFSAGVVLRPIPRLVVTLDGYYIKIKDRIVSSGSITGQNASPFPTPGVRVLTPLINGLTPYQLVTNAIAASGKVLDPTVSQSGSLGIQTFTNGIDTETWGLEFAARYPVNLSFGKLDLSVTANYNSTKVTQSRLGTLFNEQARAIIEQASPDFKAVASALFTTGPFTANLRATYYAETVALVQPNAFASTVAGGSLLRPIGDPVNGFFEGIVKPATIFDLELSYDATQWFNIAVGANNLFNKKPEIPALVPGYDAANPNAGWLAGRSPYINNGGAINGPYGHGPYGTNVGYYDARVTSKF